MNTSADLLEEYLRALRHDPNALPPTALDPELAHFARQLVGTRAQAGEGARSSVWQRVLLAQRKNGTPPAEWKEQSMTTYPPSQSKSRTGYWLVAAIGILMIGFITLLATNLRTPPTETPLAAALQGEATATSLPTNTATHSMTSAPTSTATATATPTAYLPPTATPLPGGVATLPSEVMIPTLIAPDMMGQVILPPTAVPIMALPPAETIDITPYSFGAPDYQGQYSSAITPQAAAIGYRFTADRDGMVFAELKSSNISMVGMSFSVTRADSSGGGGGGGASGGGSMGGGPSISLKMQGQVTTFGVTAGDEVQIVVGSSMGNTDRALTYTLRVVLNDVIDLGANPFEGNSDNRLDGFSNPVALYRFEAEAGEIVTIRATGADGFDTRLELLDTTMIPLPDISRSTDDNSGPGYDAEIYRYGLPYTGVYHVLLRPGSFGYGQFRMEISALEHPSLDDGAQVVRFNAPYPPELRFSGRGGETVTIRLRHPQEARDYRVETAQITVFQGDIPFATYSVEAAAMPIPLNPEDNIILSAVVTLPFDGEFIVQINANGVLSAPSTQDFMLEARLDRT